MCTERDRTETVRHTNAISPVNDMVLCTSSHDGKHPIRCVRVVIGPKDPKGPKLSPRLQMTSQPGVVSQLMPHFSQAQRTVSVGDAVVLILMTVVGFVTHLTLDAIGRMVITTLGVLVAWAAVAPFLGVYEERTFHEPGAVWRVAWAWLLAAPLAAFLRAMALDRDIAWVFVLVLIATNGIALTAWRIFYGWRSARR